MACDAELQEKPLAELRRLGELLRERCTASMTELQAQKENESTHNEDSNLSGPAQKRRGRGPSFKLGGVSVNAKSVMAAEKELEVLDEALPSDPIERRKWILDARYELLFRRTQSNGSQHFCAVTENLCQQNLPAS